MNRTNFPRGCILSLVLLTSCREPIKESDLCGLDLGDVTINEVVSNNEGVFVDQTGSADDWIEIVNNSDEPLALREFALRDKKTTSELPDLELAPGERILLWADGEPEQGDDHLDFSISSDGEEIALLACGGVIDVVEVPRLEDDEAWSRFPDGSGDFEVCRYTSPQRPNPKSCAPPRAQGLSDSVSFDSYGWSAPHPPVPSPLALSELRLRPAGFIELENTDDEVVNLEGYAIQIAPIKPGQSLPELEDAPYIELDAGESLDPGEFFVVEINEEDLGSVAQDPLFEGVVSVFDPEGHAVERWDFMRYPEGASLARLSSEKGGAVFCDKNTEGEPNDCDMMDKRNVGDRVRALRTRGDFAALAQGGTNLGTSAVKFVVDVAQGRRVHLLRSLDWALHYTFIRETIFGEEPLDRCNPVQRLEFNQGWYEFSVTEYFATEGRSFFLGTLVKHGSTGHKTVEFALGDVILPEDMRDTFFTVTEKVPDAEEYAIRPQGDSQVERAQSIEGSAPLLSPNAPFRDLVYQPLTRGVGFGVLTFVPAKELSTTALGAQVILVTDDVPNDIPLVGGLITQAFQTPLAHVNVLSQNRGTPNMALADALDDPRISEHLGELVRLEVAGDDFSVFPAAADEAAEFWKEHRPSGLEGTPRLDASVRELVDLKDASLESVPYIGAKAAQMAELLKVDLNTPDVCRGISGFSPPDQPFAVPVAYFLDHFEESGARERLQQAQQEEDFGSDPLFRSRELEKVRGRIFEHPVDEGLLGELEDEIRERFGSERVRFRSSSNAEDLPGFNGAGLYTSVSGALDDDKRPIEDALRTVWASLYATRAFDERALAQIDHEEVAMAVLVHPAFLSEAANGVGVSRNVLDPVRGDIYYLNSQSGEASVTNPAPGVTTEALNFQWPPRQPLLSYQSTSSLTFGAPVLSEEEATGVACALYEIHQHFRPLIDPEEQDPWFAMEIEYKLLYPSRELIVKQARPHAFSGFEVAGDCREF